MARTSLSQRVVVNINMMDIRRKTRKPRKKQSQITLTRQSGLRMIPSMYPVYINPSVSQNPVASYAGTHQVDTDIRMKSSQIEHPGLTTRQPVAPDPEMVTPAMAAASHIQHQTPAPPSPRRKVTNPLTGQPVVVGPHALRNPFNTGYYDENLVVLPGKEELASNWVRKHRRSNR